MGVVYKAQDVRLDRAVALKFLSEGMAHDKLALERFRREAHSASALNHPGICTIYDIGEHEGQPFLAMEFIDGETLRQHLHGNPLPMEEVLSLGIQIADALDVAHAEGIVHRDLKPANIFVTKRGQAKIVDFGLAKLVSKPLVAAAAADGSLDSDASSIVGVISGTPSYMSPEQIRGDELDTRSDVFSLGLLLYEMTTGRRAFGGGTGGAIIEAILTRLPAPVRSLNPEVSPELEAIVNRAMDKDRDRRYQSAAQVRSDLQALKRAVESGQTATMLTAVPLVRWRHWRIIAGCAAAVMIALGIGGWLLYARRARALQGTDTIVLADFTNSTGEAVFDEALRQGLAVQLEESPFLGLVSDQRIQQTLQLMGRAPDSKLAPTVARDLCQRIGSKAYVSGSISSLGNQYVIGINAVNCETGDYLAQEQATADGKEHVLKSLSDSAARLRGKLGESLKSVQKLDTPIDEATTPSLEALQAYSLGRKMMLTRGDYATSVRFFQRAIGLDPNFAMAYASLGTSYHNLGEITLSAENTQKAYELRARVSDWERFYIESHYYHLVTGDLEKARKVYELWAQTYPREQVAPTNLGVVYQALGQHEKSLAEFRQALELGPLDGLVHGDLVVSYIHLDRLREAAAAATQALAKNLDSPDLRLYRYELSYLAGDSAGMAQQLAAAAGKAEEENGLLYLQASTAADSGQLAKARDISRQAAASAMQADEKEMAADCEAGVALWEAWFGEVSGARNSASQALAVSKGRDPEYVAALALAVSGDSNSAQLLEDDLEKRFPADTVVQFNYLPALGAQIDLNRDAAAKAVEDLHIASSYELGVPGNSSFSPNLYPVYIRGEAYLKSRNGKQAAAEFQRILDHRGLVLNEPIGALAHLGLARAYVISGDSAKARVAYQDFFNLWKEADPDVPVLKQAQAEYSKL